MIDRIVVWALTLPYRVREESGQDLTEYALLTGGIAILLVGAVGLLKVDIGEWFGRLGAWFDTLTPS
jgi:Flp pilus assembly pilin Flp